MYRVSCNPDHQLEIQAAVAKTTQHDFGFATVQGVFQGSYLRMEFRVLWATIATVIAGRGAH